MNGHHDDRLQRITITVDIPAEPGTETTAAGALLDVLNHLQHEGIQPTRITLEITGPTTTT
jgi:hypothetical protein